MVMESFAYARYLFSTPSTFLDGQLVFWCTFGQHLCLLLEFRKRTCNQLQRLVMDSVTFSEPEPVCALQQAEPIFD